MKWKELYAQARAKAVAAQALLEANEVSEEDENAAEGLLSEAAVLSKRAEALKSAAGIVASVGEPQLPAGLPSDDDDLREEDHEDDSQPAAFFQLRYGEGNEPAATKAILKDLHGGDYEQQRYAQTIGFNRYLRGGDSAVRTQEHTKALSNVVFTPELVQMAIRQGQDVRALRATMVEAVDTLGGIIVPVDFQMDVIKRMVGLTIMRGRARVSQTSRDQAQFPVLTGGDSQYPTAVRVTAVDETPTAGTAETNLTFGLETIPVHTVMAEVPLSRNLVEDAAFNIAEELTVAFAEGSAVQEDNWFLTGDGNGRPQGLLPSSANDHSLTEVNSGATATLTSYDAVIDLTYQIDSQYRQAESCSFIAEKATTQTIAKLKDANGAYLWDRADRQGGRLEGYAYLEQEAMPTIAANAFAVLFGDLAGYRIVDRVGMSIERYLDSQTARQNLLYYVMRRRFGGQVVETWRFGVMKIAA